MRNNSDTNNYTKVYIHEPTKQVRLNHPIGFGKKFSGSNLIRNIVGKLYASIPVVSHGILNA